jgi:hypothetical protein
VAIVVEMSVTITEIKTRFSCTVFNCDIVGLHHGVVRKN